MKLSWMKNNDIVLIVKQKLYLHFLSGKIDKHDLTGEQILGLEQNALRKQVKSNFSFLGKVLEK